MKRFIKRAFRAAYGRTEFIRRPLREELEANLKACVSGSFDEVRMVMDDLVAEVCRLQNQVADLSVEVARLNAAQDDFATAR
jgi:hypothetical protein